MERLQLSDYEDAAFALGIDVATIRAVVEVESTGSGFIGDKPKILFEGHVFWRRLLDKGYEEDTLRVLSFTYYNVLYPSWTKAHYLGGDREYARLRRAMEIDEEAALESASWGLFQIMGYHWRVLGYLNIFDFVSAMHARETQQLDAFVRYIRTNNLAKSLRERDWASFARAYNGKSYALNQYDVKLRNAYEKYKNA